MDVFSVLGRAFAPNKLHEEKTLSVLNKMSSPMDQCVGCDHFFESRNLKELRYKDRTTGNHTKGKFCKECGDALENTQQYFI